MSVSGVGSSSNNYDSTYYSQLNNLSTNLPEGMMQMPSLATSESGQSTSSSSGSNDVSSGVNTQELQNNLSTAMTGVYDSQGNLIRSSGSSGATTYTA